MTVSQDTWKRIALCGSLTVAALVAASASGCFRGGQDDGPVEQVPDGQKVTVAISCGAVGTQLQLCKEGAEAWAARTGHSVKLVSTPNSATERLALYQQILGARGGDIDVFQIDVIWPGILVNHLIDLAPLSKGIQSQHFPSIVKNNTVKGKLVGMPWYTDAGLLYYRKDLLDQYGEQPPTTWAELARIASAIQSAERTVGNRRMWGFVWQGRAYEGLTCDALEWIVSHGGGSIVEPDGAITINNPRAIAAIDTAAGWIGRISPKDMLNSAEEEARGVFQSGNAVFMRNWPYAWALAQGDDSPVQGKVGVMPLPTGGQGGRHAATLGGWQLAVSRYSRKQRAAADLVMYLTSRAEQKRRAIVGAYNPTIPDLYRDQDVLQANPFLGSLYDTFVNATPRPSTVTGRKYNQVSSRFVNAVHAVLSGKKSAAASLATLEKRLKRLSRGGKWP